MKKMLKIVIVAIPIVLMLIADIQFLPVQLVPEANAIFGVWRRHARRWAVVGTAAVATTAAVTTAAAAAAIAAHPTTVVVTQPAPPPTTVVVTPSAPPPAAAGKPLPVGTVVAALPGGCVSTPVSGVEYYYCGGNFYRAVFQGNNLVYVTAQPK